ncbi:MAG TPA: competence protein CoiA family protein [Candidatus Anammoximicrobium sp.]|nr:competence protein CoiA family protein [Candidatus Anammoximicrobium sp.]
MFKALDTELDRHVVSLDPAWDGQIEVLRGWGRAGRLVCPVCRQAVLLRAGEIMRRHFAHKDLSQCPLSRESAELLAGRAALYAWLNTKFPDGVTLEKHFEADAAEEYQLPRGVDCWVERPGKRSLAYWLVDGKIDPDDRVQIPRFLEARNAALNWVFLPRDARRGRLPGRANLSATERALLTPSEFDAVYSEGGGSEGSLHCLDPDSQVLTTYRALVCVELPQYYEGREVATELKQVLVLPGTGEFVHPGEYERLLVVREELRRQEEARRKAQEAAERRRAERATAAQAAAARAAVQAGPAKSPPSDRTQAPAKPFDFLAARTSWLNRPETPAAIEEPEGTCTLCGRRTRDWVVFDTKTGECKCRECLRKQEKGPAHP